MSSPGADQPVVLRRARSVRGEVVLRQRELAGELVHELITNGAFAMDSRETSTEQLLAHHATVRPGARVLVGGLGLGYTADALLGTSVGELVVVEIEECLVDWARDGVSDVLARVATDPRVELRVDDVHRVLTEPDGTDPGWDAVVLDVDNGPDFLIHPANERLYVANGLRAAVAQLRPGGTLVLWCQGFHDGLDQHLHRVAGPGDEVAVHRHPIEREGRRFTYAVHSLTRARSADDSQGL